MNRLYSKKTLRVLLPAIAVANIFLAGVSIFLKGGKQVEPAVQENKALAQAIITPENETSEADGQENGLSNQEPLLPANTVKNKRAEPAVSEADREAVDKFKAKWDRWAPYAEINQLLEKGRWDEILRMVREGEFGVNQPVNPAGMTLIEIALKRSYMEGVRALYELGADLTPPGRNIVRIVCSAGNLEGLKFLHDHGVDITGEYGISGLRSAIRHDYLDIIDYFMELGLSPEVAEGSSRDVLSMSITPKTFGETTRRLMELGYELEDKHVYEIAGTANPVLVEILLENGFDLGSIRMDQRQIRLYLDKIFQYYESQGIDLIPDSIFEGETFMDAVINSRNTDVAFLQYLETKGLYANQTQLERVRYFSENYSEQVILLGGKGGAYGIHYPHAAKVAEYIAQQLGE